MSLVSENASNALTLLKGADSRLKVLGLKKLNALIDYHWHEISDSLAQMYEFEINYPKLFLVKLSTKTKLSLRKNLLPVSSQKYPIYSDSSFT